MGNFKKHIQIYEVLAPPLKPLQILHFPHQQDNLFIQDLSFILDELMTTDAKCEKLERSLK